MTAKRDYFKRRKPKPMSRQAWAQLLRRARQQRELLERLDNLQQSSRDMENKH